MFHDCGTSPILLWNIAGHPYIPPHPQTLLEASCCLSSKFFLFFLFFLNLYCSTHGDEALVGRVTVNAIFLGILIAVSPFLFIFALSKYHDSTMLL